MDDATLRIGDQELSLPTLEGTMGERAVDISALRKETSYTTFDRGFGNTAETKSSITFINGEGGILRHRGYAIEDLATKASFLEVAYLLIEGELPTVTQLATFEAAIHENANLPEDLKHLFDAFPHEAHPMAVLASGISTFGAYYPEAADPLDDLAVDRATQLLIAKMPTMVAWAFKYRERRPYIYPRYDLDYAANFLHMVFSRPHRHLEVSPQVQRAMNMLLVLHADHEQNCSASTVRIVGSSHASIFASMSAGIHALSGPLHGGANQAVLEMLQAMSDAGGDVETYIVKAKDKDDPFRLMGFGHRVYKNFDPRSRILKGAVDDVLSILGKDDPLLRLAVELEEAALDDDYFVERKLFPNVDFYSGIIYRAMGFPVDMFTSLFALGRMPGWIAQWREMHSDPTTRIGRPRQVYTGETDRPFTPIADR
jgi:citrate synthase